MRGITASEAFLRMNEVIETLEHAPAGKQILMIQMNGKGDVRIRVTLSAFSAISGELEVRERKLVDGQTELTCKTAPHVIIEATKDGLKSRES